MAALRLLAPPALAEGTGIEISERERRRLSPRERKVKGQRRRQSGITGLNREREHKGIKERLRDPVEEAREQCNASRELFGDSRAASGPTDPGLAGDLPTRVTTRAL